MWILQLFYRSGNGKCEYYSGFIDRATEIVEKPLFFFTSKEAETNWKTIGFIIKPATGNRATGNGQRIWGLVLQYSPRMHYEEPTLTAKLFREYSNEQIESTQHTSMSFPKRSSPEPPRELVGDGKRVKR